MAVKEHCGGKCSTCLRTCSIDQAIPCSPDCENLTTDGKIKVEECLNSGCDEIKSVLDMVGKTDKEVLKKYGSVASYPY